MSRCGNHEQIVVELNGFSALNYPFDAETIRVVVGVHQSFATEFLSEQLVIRNIVFVR